MDFYRRFQQNNYPPRPSPLGSSSSQEPQEHPRSSTSAQDTHTRTTHPINRYEYSSNVYGVSRAPAGPGPGSGPAPAPGPLRGQSSSAHTSPSRSHPAQHRRHASLETRQYTHAHNDSPHFQGQQEQSAPAFGIRQMPPPSPPHSYASNASASSLPSRDVPGSQAHRPGSSMSISAMLGSEPERPARDTGSSMFSRPSGSPMFGSAPTSATAMSPPTARARPSPLDQSLYRRSHTPETTYSRPPLNRPYRSGSGGGSSLLNEQSKFGGLSRASPSQSHSTHPSPQIPTAEPPSNGPRRMSFSGPIARPNSQPLNVETSTRPPRYSPLSRSGAGLPERYEPGQRVSTVYGGPDSLGRDPRTQFGNLFGERSSEDNALRDRDRAMHGAEGKGALSGALRYTSSIYGERDPLDRHVSTSTWDQGRSHPPSPEIKRFPAPESGPAFGFGAIQSYTKSLGSQPGGSRQPPISLQTGHVQTTASPHDSPYPSKQLPPHMGSTPTTAASIGSALLGLATAGEEGRRKGSEELLHHRSLLAVGVDGKRGGRASPLPQAVQGAQAPFIGASGEPGIKNELGRVFSGIGSGVGGVTGASAGSGPSTPLIASPFKHDSLAGRSMNGEDDKNPRPASDTGRRSRKSRDEDASEHDVAGLSARTRRARHAHPHHHHHHHHHRQKVDEEAAALGLHRPMSTAYFGRTSTPSDSQGGHHHHHHHHHHHPLRPTIAATSPIREPRTMVNLKPLLSSVAHLPRHHLGSTLYAPRIETPSERASSESSKFGYATTPQPLPQFEKRENCTFTVRVPRYRIAASHREEICARRALWGTGVYTDDSDPVAAAIHSGFIRGAWGDDVDESMLDLEIKDTYEHAPQLDTDTSNAAGPRFPPLPPPDRDLHITLLLLPRLEQYDSTVMFGIKSRLWNGRHDGMSFKVHRIDWVDDGVGRGEERSGEARRKRLRTLMQTGRICTGPAMAKMDKLRQSGVQVPRAVDGPERPTPVQAVS
ncbi:hypothetical protein N7495_000057 [Penicillium taxi]|uniref:uncharacterized protein n=1 Tax=Penicillium taxi TaxID=168475 RepID=UPI002545B49B|nr:uncharacterized protein N7495_000057 [Penicillium taxi]KAJ5907375.1 hypothetical protein N7495_000057 [Penicillium taxi]